MIWLSRISTSLGDCCDVLLVRARIFSFSDQACTLKPAGGLDFRKEKSFGKYPAGLLAETDDGRCAHDVAKAGAGGFVGPNAAWMSKLNTTQAAQPIKLYQR